MIIPFCIYEAIRQQFPAVGADHFILAGLCDVIGNCDVGKIRADQFRKLIELGKLGINFGFISANSCSISRFAIPSFFFDSLAKCIKLIGTRESSKLMIGELKDPPPINPPVSMALSVAIMPPIDSPKTAS